MQLIIDYEDLEAPISIYNQTEVAVPLLKNEHGEADYNVWYHCIHSMSNNVVVVGSDTDIWVYGVALLESGWLGDKQIYVEKNVHSEYLHINHLLQNVQSHPKLNAIPHVGNCLLAIYLLTGCDYVSSFYKTSKQKSHKPAFRY